MKKFIEFATNFTSKFTRLSRDFLADDPRWNIPLSLVNLFASVVYSLPFTGLAYAISLMMADKEGRTLKIRGFELYIDVTHLIVWSIVIGFLIYVARFFLGQKLLKQVSKWQGNLLLRSLDVINEVSKFAYVRPFIPAMTKTFHAHAARMAGAGSQIGLLFIFGIHSLVTILFCAFAILVMDWRVFIILALSGILFMPFYALCLRRIFQVRDNTEATIRAAQRNLKARVSVIEGSPVFNDGPTVTPPPIKCDAVGVILVNRQYAEILLLRLLVAIHMGTLLLVFIFTLMKLAIPTAIIFSMAVFVFIMVTTLGNFIQFIGNLTRNYTYISALADHVRPHRKFKTKGCAIHLKLDANSIFLNFGDVILIQDSFPEEKLAYQKLSSVLWPGETEHNILPQVAPLSEVYNYLEASESHPRTWLEKIPRPAVVAITPAKFLKLSPQHKSKFVWAIYSNNCDESLAIDSDVILTNNIMSYELVSA